MALGLFCLGFRGCYIKYISQCSKYADNLFVAQHSYPVIHKSPREVKCGYSIYQAFTNSGCGHNNAVLSKCTIDPTLETKTKADCCTCGKNSASTDTSHCIPVTQSTHQLFHVGA